MAQGTGDLAGDLSPQGPTPTSTPTPSFDIPNVADDWARIGETFDRFNQTLQPSLNQLAAQHGQQEGAAAAASGQPVKVPLALGETGQAQAQAFQAGYLATIRNSIDTRDDQLRTQFRYDPDGYATAAQSATSGFIQGAPDAMAVDVENYANDIFDKGHQEISITRQGIETQRSLTALKTRVDMDKQAILGLAAQPNGVQSQDFVDKYNDYFAAWKELTTNPAFSVPDEQRQQDDQELLENVRAAPLVRAAAQISASNGGGFAGQAAARRYLSKSLLGIDQPVSAADVASPADRQPAADPDWSKPSNVLNGILGGPVTITSGTRTAAQQNALIAQGLTTTPPSQDEHVAGTAVDFHPPAGMSNQQAVTKLVQAGIPFNQIIDEGTHVHIGWGGQHKGEVFSLINGVRTPISVAPASGFQSVPASAAPPPPPQAVVSPTAPPVDAASAQAAAASPAPNGQVDPAFADIPLANRQRIYQKVTQQINDYWKADNDSRIAQDEADRAATTARLSAAGTWALKVQIGAATEKDVMGATDIDDGQKAVLVNGVRAQARRDASEQAAQASAARRDAREAYFQWSDAAKAGTITDGEIAQGIQSAQISPGQAMTLKALRTTALKPQIDDVLAPVRDYAKRPGMSLTGTAVPIARAEAAATDWVTKNPQSTQDDRLKAGAGIAASVFGHAPGTVSGGQNGVLNAKVAQITSLENERASRANAGHPMGQTEYDQRRTAIINAN